MKHLLLFFLIFNFVGINAQPKDGSSPLFNDPDLGKTHFIVGLPPEKIAHAQKAVCRQTGLPGLLRCNDGSFKKAFFSPDDDLEKLLVQLIDHEQESIKAAIFSFTNGVIADALIAAKKRGVHIEVITDIAYTRDKFNKIDRLKTASIPVHVYNPQNTTIFNDIMHNKFVLFGKNVESKSLLWTGSFNFTKSATMNNQENVVILDEIHLIERYQKQFVVLKDRIAHKAPIKLANKKKRFITTIPS